MSPCLSLSGDTSHLQSKSRSELGGILAAAPVRARLSSCSCAGQLAGQTASLLTHNSHFYNRDNLTSRETQVKLITQPSPPPFLTSEHQNSPDNPTEFPILQLLKYTTLKQFYNLPEPLQSKQLSTSRVSSPQLCDVITSCPDCHHNQY